MRRQRRFSSRISGSRTSTMPMSPGARASEASAARTIARNAAASPLELAGLATEIGIRAGPAPRIVGVGRADVEDRRHHREERLADARQLLERQAALVQLPLL